jgi:Putative porin
MLAKPRNDLIMKTHTHTIFKATQMRHLLVCLLMAPSFSYAQTDAAPIAVERLHQTTLGILDALVAKGILTQKDADAIVDNAKEKAKTVAPLAADSSPAGQAISGPGVRPAAGSDTVRIPFVPEVVKRELREEIRKEVIAQAKSERWMAPESLPEWASRIKVSGDVRVRLQSDRIAASSGGAREYFDNEDYTNFAGLSNVENLSRARIRARLAVDATVSDDVLAGVRLSTGNQTSPVSSSSTAGDSANRFGLKIDRAFIRYKPVQWLTVDAGRLANPFLSSDLMFAPELGLDGFSASVRPKLESSVLPFAILGTFPLRNNPFAGNRKLNGAQLGADWALSDKTNFKFAYSRYGVTGAAGSPSDDRVGDPAYNSTEYESGFRQRGNTLFRINQDPTDTSSPVYGLASKFNINSLYASVELKHFDPTRLTFSAETITNKGFNEDEITQRLGVTGIESRNRGYTVRMVAGTPVITKRGEWQLGLGVRKLERDATLDALTDPDFVLGGTNVKGQFLTFSYGIEKNTSVGLRYLSGETIDAPFSNPNLQPLKVRTIQLDMSVRF